MLSSNLDILKKGPLPPEVYEQRGIASLLPDRHHSLAGIIGLPRAHLRLLHTPYTRIEETVCFKRFAKSYSAPERAALFRDTGVREQPIADG